MLNNWLNFAMWKWDTFRYIKYIGLTLFLLLFSGCSTVSDVWDSTTDKMGVLLRNDEVNQPVKAGIPDLADSPQEVGTIANASERENALNGLISDRKQSQYTQQVRRSDPVDVRPLKEKNSILGKDDPPNPIAAPRAEVREAGELNSVNASLAERLGAAPPPPPGTLQPDISTMGSFDSARIDSDGKNTELSISRDSNTTDSSVAADAVLRQNSINRNSNYDSVSSLVGTITFSAGSSKLNSNSRRIIDDIVKLREKYNGNLRIVGHASSRTQDLDPLKHKLVNFSISLKRANAVSDALLAKGVPFNRLTVGAVSDNEIVYTEAMPGGANLNQRAEIFLDY